MGPQLWEAARIIGREDRCANNRSTRCKLPQVRYTKCYGTAGKRAAFSQGGALWRTSWRRKPLSWACKVVRGRTASQRRQAGNQAACSGLLPFLLFLICPPSPFLLFPTLFLFSPSSSPSFSSLFLFFSSSSLFSFFHSSFLLFFLPPAPSKLFHDNRGVIRESTKDSDVNLKASLLQLFCFKPQPWS